ncbi:MAG: glycoside hydrolase family 3 C-terminal domain-containing protein, partial [Muribaculaceae bacterium]|nr:glycoside hydrolase family 3 C-terminal domain-containing protein [Muribaculaceae bacterium]
MLRTFLSITLCCLLFSTVHAYNPDDERYIDNLMSKMSLDEKIGQLNLTMGGDVVSGTAEAAKIESLILKGQIGGFFNVKGVDAVARFQHLAVEKGPHGIPLLVGADVVHGYATVFPIPLALSCSWDSAAVAQMARISAIEATADGVNWNYSPMVDICRDPRWGRVAESSGEDTYLGSVLAKAYVEGYQGNDMKSDSSMMACVKHFALYGAAEGGRDYNGVDMSRERMYNYYLPPFHATVEAGVGSLMTSFNLINGQHATACDWLINGILRRDWKFNGFVVTDYGSVDELSRMGIAHDNEAAAMALRAGTDMDMVTGRYVADLNDALKKGLLTEKMIDDACRRVLKAKQRLGLFDNPYKYCNTDRVNHDLYTPEHRAVARDIAAETFVLLKNDNNLLPLKKKGRIALIGPLADAGNNMAGCWSGYCYPESHKSVLTAFREAVGNEAEIIYSQGSNIYYNETMQADCDWGRRISRVDASSAHREALLAAST